MAGLDPSQSMPSVSSNKGMVNWLSNETLDKMEDDRILADRPQPEPLDSLASHIRDFFASAKDGKLIVENQMLSILRQIKGEYEPDKLQAIKDMGGSDDFVRLTQHKVRDAEAQIIDVLNPYGDRTWDIESGPIPEIPPDIQAMITQQVKQMAVQQAVMQAQATGQPVNTNDLAMMMKGMQDQIEESVKQKAKQVAEERATNMEKLIIKQLDEGGWHKAFKACINDLSRLKFCVMKGPIYRMEKGLKWEPSPLTGKYEPVVTDNVTLQFERVSPFDWYPAANSIDVDDGDVVELEHLTRRDLNKLLGVPGYKDDAIRAILNEYAKGYKETTPIEAERFYLEKDNTTGLNDQIIDKLDLINYWGQVQGKVLLEWGMSPEEVSDPDIDYQINGKMIGRHVIKAVLNPDPLGRKPYGVTSFSKSNDSQIGECPAEFMADLQSICNATVRAMVNNIATSSGPLTEIDIDRLATGESPDIWPHKVIQTTNKRMQEGPAVRFYQANLLAKELLLVYDKFKREADDLVVPAYGHGNPNVQGAGKTSSGLAMLMSAAARNIKLAIMNIDQDIIIPTIERLFVHNMRFIDDDSIKGDLHVKPRGSTTLIIKDQLAIRRKEFLAETLNPVDSQIMGIQGRAYILGENIKSLEMDPRRALPNLEAIEKMAPGAQMFGLPGPGAPPPGDTPTDVNGNPQGGGDSNSFQQEAQ
jgi:hypothetical protein